MTTASLWHNNNGRNCELYLAEIPTTLHKYNMLTSIHLVELETLFEQIIHKAHYDSISLFDSALQVCPDVLLHDSDEYTASLINHLSQTGKTNIFVVCGYGQSRTIPYHLYHNPRAFQDNGLNTTTRFNMPFSTLLRADTPEIMTDKLAIIDQIFNSESLQPNTSSLTIINSKIRPNDDNSDLIEIYTNLIQTKYKEVREEQ